MFVPFDENATYLQLQCKSWDLSLVSKEGMDTMYLQKQEAIAKRERMKQYSFSHRVILILLKPDKIDNGI